MYGAINQRVRSLLGKTDEELVAEVIEGKTASFGDLTSRYRRAVEHWCRRFFSDREMIRDLSQESFIRAFTGLTGYRADMPFRGWLRAITVNVCYDELRRRVRRPEELIGDLTQAEQAWMQLVTEATPEAILQAAEDRAAADILARKLLNHLRPEDRVVMTLKEAEDLSIAEIAEIMGWSEAKVKIRAFRARRLMKRRAEPLLVLRRRG
ncbi:MAG: RNA polymerase sigma factor [Candidatus Binataceae bacterium]